ncbi:hypothetical protein A3G62_02895 [Candidatus Kaiserbacteria bacterium RIFCSPLOWO2_12_FULL_50_10]|nr:MAG: hypothetical protein A3G62_02895 [Candidatus Kaiserbacteria bacterium RIFCSPLOWO2_12_FULL_50_10]
MNIANQQVSETQRKRYIRMIIIGNLSLLFIFAVTLTVYVQQTKSQSAPLGLFGEKKLSIIYSSDTTLSLVESSQIDSMRLAVKEIDYEIAGYPIEIREMNNGVGLGSKRTWSADLETRNAYRAANDPSVIAYVGPGASGAAQISMPLLNYAGIPQISLSNTYPGLTRPGYAQGEPEKFYPTGVRHYFRMTANDADQSRVVLDVLKEEGQGTVSILDDGSTYGRGLAREVGKLAADEAILITHSATLSTSTESGVSEAQAILTASTSAVFYGGSNGDAFLAVLQTLHDAGYAGIIIGADGLTYTNFLNDSKGFNENVYVTGLGKTLTENDGEMTKNFIVSFESEYHRKPTATDATAYDAMKLLLYAIEKNGIERDAIIEAFNTLEDFRGVLGTIDFDEYGDATRKSLQLFQIKNNAYTLVRDIEYQEK